MERALRDEYEAQILTLISTLSTDNHALAVAIASIPDKIRGFGHVKERHVKSAKAEEAALLERWNNPAAEAAGNWRRSDGGRIAQQSDANAVQRREP